MTDMQIMPHRAQCQSRDIAESSTSLQPLAADAFAYEVRESVIAEYLGKCGRHRTILVILAVFGVVASLIASFAVHPTFQATALIEIQRINENFFNLKDVTPVSQAPMDVTLDDVQAKMKLLQTPGLIARVMSRLGMLNRKPEEGLVSQLTALLAPLLAPFNRVDHPADPVEAAVHRVAKHLEVKAVGRTNLIEVSYESKNSKEAADFANALVKEFNQQDIESRGSMNEHTRDFANRQIEDLRENLTQSEHALERYAKKAGLVFFQETSGLRNGSTTPDTISMARLRQVQDDLSKARDDRFAKESAYELTKHSTPLAVPDIVADSSIRDVQSKLADLNRERAALAAAYTPEYSKLKRANAEVASLEQTLSTQREILLDRVRNDYVQALGREQLLMKDYVDQARTVNEDAAKSVQYDVLKRDVESARQFYDDVLQHMKEASLVAALRAGNVRVVDPARVPNDTYKPSFLLNAAVGLVGGLFVGIVWIGHRERGNGIRNPGELKTYLNASELGAVRSAERMHHHRVRILVHLQKQKTPELLGGSGENTRFKALDRKAKTSLELITSQPEPSVITQSFRSVLTSINFCEATNNVSRVYVVTSPSAGEGKTTVASNLAIMLAETYKRVLLVDGDLHKPRLHDVFNVVNDVGLGELLQPEESGGSATLASAVRQTRVVDGLSLLTSGVRSDHTGQLIFSMRLPHIFNQIRANYDAVVIDTPPLLDFADARVLGRLADAVILVTRSRRTTRAGAAAALDRLHEDGTRVLGSVLNDWDPKKTSSTYYVDR